MSIVGTKKPNSVLVDGASWQDRYQLSSTVAAYVENVVTIAGGGKEKVIAYAPSGSAITDAHVVALNSLPVGSMIVDANQGKTFFHANAWSWICTTGSVVTIQ